MREIINDAAMRLIEASQVLRLYAPGPCTEATILVWGWQFEVWSMFANFGQAPPDYGLDRYPTVCG